MMDRPAAADLSTTPEACQHVPNNVCRLSDVKSGVAHLTREIIDHNPQAIAQRFTQDEAEKKGSDRKR